MYISEHRAAIKTLKVAEEVMVEVDIVVSIYIYIYVHIYIYTYMKICTYL